MLAYLKEPYKHKTFIPDFPPLSEQLLSSIRTTYQYLLLGDQKPDHKVVEKISLVRNGSTKINLSISVPVLALALKTDDKGWNNRQ